MMMMMMMKSNDFVFIHSITEEISHDEILPNRRTLVGGNFDKKMNECDRDVPDPV